VRQHSSSPIRKPAGSLPNYGEAARSSATFAELPDLLGARRMWPTLLAKVLLRAALEAQQP